MDLGVPLLCNFNSRPSARGDLSICTPPVVLWIFQFTPLREGRRGNPYAPLIWQKYFNSRPSARGDRRRKPPRTSQIGHFNSRPSARGDAMRGDSGTSDDISIHAPPRGATSPDTTTGRDNHISIHAPPRGATYHQQRSATYRLFQFTPLREGRRHADLDNCTAPDFNSRPSARGDQAPRARVRPRQGISIHAPPRGAT